MFQSWVTRPVHKYPRRRIPLALERCEERLPPGQLLSLLMDPLAETLGPAPLERLEPSLGDDAFPTSGYVRPLGGIAPPAPDFRAATTAAAVPSRIHQGSRPQSAAGAWAGTALGDSWAGDLLDAANALTAPERGWRTSSLWSAQVNVDAQGNNIAGDAANEPSLAVDPTDPRRLVIGWRQFDSVLSDFRQAGWGYSHDAGRAWTFAGVIQPGVFRSDPVLDVDADGNFYYQSLNNAFTNHVFKSTDGGVSWDGGTFAYGGDKNWMTIDRTDGPGRGNIYATWNLAIPCCGGDFTRSTNGGASFEAPRTLGFNPILGTLSAGPESQLYIGGVNGSTLNFLALRSTNAHDPGVTPTFAMTPLNLGGTFVRRAAPNPGGLQGQVWIATDHSAGPSRGNVYILCSVDPPGPDPMDVMIVRSTDGGVTFGPPVRVNDGPGVAGSWQWFGTLSVAPNGRLDVVWVDTRGSLQPNLGQLYYASSADGGATWSPNLAASPVFDSHVGWPQQNKLGDYYQAVSDDKGVNVAYAATFNGEQDVYFLRINVEPTSLV